MKIRKIDVLNFRGIKHLEWKLPDQQVFCLIGKGDSAKTTILEAILNSLPGPQLIVPGNHDVPLYNIFARFLQPFKKYARYINPDLNPVLWMMKSL